MHTGTDKEMTGKKLKGFCENHGDRFLIPGYDLASLLSLRFTVLPAKVITFLESSKLFVEESKAWSNDS